MNRYSKPPRDRYKSYWLSASNYYVLTLAVALAVFFLVMGLLHEGNEEPFIPAGIAASAVLVSAVIVRRAIMKNHQMRVHAARRLENNLASLRANAPLLEKKLTIEKNASIQISASGFLKSILAFLPKHSGINSNSPVKLHGCPIPRA